MRLGEVAEAVGGGYCRLQMPLKRERLALGGQWLGIGWAPSRGGKEVLRGEPTGAVDLGPPSWGPAAPPAVKSLPLGALSV